MITPHNALYAACITLGLSALQLAGAESAAPPISVSAAATEPNASVACASAEQQAEGQATAQLDQYFASLPGAPAYRARLLSRQEARNLLDDGQTRCEVSAVWTGEVVASARDLIGSEQYIDGQYVGSCLDEHSRDLCWQRLTRQAREDLFADLADRYDDTAAIELVYVDFEGRQRDSFAQGRMETEADGRFYFDVVDRDRTSAVRIERRDQPPAPASDPLPAAPAAPAESAEKDAIDVTLFYVWDGNDSAWNDDLAISSDRWGVGVWANNRVGFVAFKGEDTLGIGDRFQNVKDDRETYETFGVGFGYRLWQTRGLTLENMLYYVDAQPFSSVVAPANCSGCTPRSYTARDYLQATVNVKTNSSGFNLGWMFTWKFMEEQTNIDRLSSGLYLELQL